MVTEFPIFSKLALQDKQFLDTYNAQFTPYADWAFGTLIAWWDLFDDLEVALLNGNLVIKSSYLSMGERSQLVLLGNSQIDETIDTLFSYQKDNGVEPELYSLPQYTVDAIRHPEKYLIIDDQNAAEYVLSTEMHTLMQGHSMYKIRQRVALFKRATKEHLVEVAPIELDTLPAKMRIINSLHTWTGGIYRNDNERLEGIVLDKSLLVAEHIGLHCLGLFINKEIHGFALYKHLSGGSANVNHIKVSYQYPELFSYITHELASKLYKEGFETLNFEQDLGIESLRFHKRHLRPVEMLHKYNVYPRQLE